MDPYGACVFHVILDTGAAGCPFAAEDVRAGRDPSRVTDKTQDFVLRIHVLH